LLKEAEEAKEALKVKTQKLASDGLKTVAEYTRLISKLLENCTCNKEKPHIVKPKSKVWGKNLSNVKMNL
jgi:hypothetical protein